jgi:hypothetical protein
MPLLEWRREANASIEIGYGLFSEFRSGRRQSGQKSSIFGVTSELFEWKVSEEHEVLQKAELSGR